MPAFACFDDAFLGYTGTIAPPFFQRLVAWPIGLIMGAALCWLNAPAYENLAGPARPVPDATPKQKQLMNSSFDRFVDPAAVLNRLGATTDTKPYNLRSLRLYTDS